MSKQRNRKKERKKEESICPSAFVTQSADVAEFPEEQTRWRPREEEQRKTDRQDVTLKDRWKGRQTDGRTVSRDQESVNSSQIKP